MVILNRREHKLQKELTEEGDLKCLMSGKMQVVHETSTEFLEPLVKSAFMVQKQPGVVYMGTGWGVASGQ